MLAPYTGFLGSGAVMYVDMPFFDWIVAEALCQNPFRVHTSTRIVIHCSTARSVEWIAVWRQVFQAKVASCKLC